MRNVESRRQGSQSVQSKQSGVLGVTCRDSFVEDYPRTPMSGRNTGTRAPGCCISSNGQPQQQGSNMGSPCMPQGWNMGVPGMPQGWNMGVPGLPQGWNMVGPGMPQGWDPAMAAAMGGWTPSCNCDESDSESSESSSSSSSDTETVETKTAEAKTKSKEKLANPNVSPWYNYDFCTCETPLPDAYIPKPKPKKKPSPAGPQAGIWCGSPCCAVAEYFPAKAKGVVHRPVQLKLKEPSSAVPPGTCCFRNDQLIFQVPGKGRKGDSEVMPFYNVGPNEQPLGVKMMRPEENPEMDPDNNTYIIKITKTDPKGKPAKMQLALKIPRPPDASVPENETTTQYAAEDLTAARHSTGHGGKGGKKNSKSVGWSKTTTTTKRTSRKSTKTSKVSKSSKLNFAGAKKLAKEYKRATK